MSKLSSLENQKIAVIGAGVGGLTAAHLLSKRHQVTLYEAGPQLGGHAHAVTLTDENGKTFDVDTAFLIFNERTYPGFLKFLAELEVSQYAIPAEMSSCFSDYVNDLHYSLGNGCRPILSKPLNYLRRSLFEIARDLYSFRKQAAMDLSMGTNLRNVSAEQYLSTYSKSFVENFVLPLTSAIWSLPSEKMKDYPIASLLDYFNNHQLLGGPRGRHWRTFQGSSRVYVNSFEKKFTGKIRKKTPVLKVSRTESGILVSNSFGETSYDHVVLATHADTALKMIANPNSQEVSLLRAWSYQDNPVTLHSDTRVLYPDSNLWCSWNMVRRTEDYQISYYLNRLQKLPTKIPVILTLDKLPRVNSPSTQFNYRHPIFNSESISTQKSLPDLNGIDRLHFCGSYFGHGFHEDAVQSAGLVAAQFGISWYGK